MDLVVRKTTYTKDDVPLFYCGVKNFSPSTILNYVNVANYIPENNPAYNTYEKIDSTVDGEGEYLLPKRFLSLPSGCLVVTNRSTNTKYQEYALPLYYEYELMYDHYSYDTTFPKGFLTLRKNNETTVSEDSFVVETRQSVVCSGRYLTTEVGWDKWGSNPVSGNVATCRLLLPLRSSQNSYYTVEYNKYTNNTVAQYYAELVDEKELYIEGLDYTITPSSVTVPYGSRMASGDPIFVQHNPDSYIEIRYPGYSSDEYKTKRWEFSVKLGTFRSSSGVINDDGILYMARNDTGLSSIPTSDEIPATISKNIIRVTHQPLIEPSYLPAASGYSFTNVVSHLYINGTDSRDTVSSLDIRRGFIMLNKILNPTDAIQITYNTNPDKVMIVRNTDLNPLFRDESLIDVAASGLGIALVPSGTIFYDVDANPVPLSGIALYSLIENTYGDFTSGIFGYGASAYRLSDLGNSVISGVIPSGSRFLGSITTNISPEANLNLVDLRRNSGYDADQLRMHTSDWRDYSDIGMWDGEALPMANVVIVQVPVFVYDNIIEIYKQDDSIDMPTTNQYPDDYAMVMDKDAVEDTSREQVVLAAANKYIRDTVERYLPLGAQYILVDENMNEWPRLRSTM